MWDALIFGFREILHDRVMLVVVIGSAVLGVWLVYELLSGRSARRQPVRDPEPIDAPQEVSVPAPVVAEPPKSERVAEIVQSLRERDERQVAAIKRKRRRRVRVVKAKARKRGKKRAA